MNIYVLLLIFIFFYILKGGIWFAFDIFVFKSKYYNVIQVVFSIGLWPIASLIRTFNLIKNYINK
jgi:hypothetical protein